MYPDAVIKDYSAGLIAPQTPQKLIMAIAHKLLAPHKIEKSSTKMK
ncbi:MAG: hypothetical protein QNJ38_13525 [Prochloraceae cyanobacterium]|nr:hypothetical protein [Prochloraceae cyanobacterium]